MLNGIQKKKTTTPVNYNILKPTKQVPLSKDIYGFDIETYDKNRKFLVASIVGDNTVKLLESKEAIVKELSLKKYKGSFIAATNLAFDFMGSFYKTDALKNFRVLWRDSSMLVAKTYVDKQALTHSRKGKPITFIDTGNYAFFSVETWGDILGLNKFEKPTFLGKVPKTKKEWNIMINYNVRDSLISKKALELLYKGFIEIGASPKITVASTALSLWRNKYQTKDYFRHSEIVLEEQYNAYYGGRVEAISRGLLNDAYFYDVNSLYPHVMAKNVFPDPNSLRINHYNELDYIYNYEGISDVTIFCPYMDYPLLPYRFDSKLLFPTGTFRGWHTHIELREALKLGYVIKKVHKCMYYNETERPFADYVKDVYGLRMRYKAENNPLEVVAKLLLNSLYGKFGFKKWMKTEEWLPMPEDLETFGNYAFEIIGDYVKLIKGRVKAPNYCIPIWSIYTTAYGRLHLHNLIIQSGAHYYDTDSILTTKKMITGNKLGELKLEMKVDNAIIVRPKFYMLHGEFKDKYKVKGVGCAVGSDVFNKLVSGEKVLYNKFTKFREALRRGLTPNELIETSKQLSLEDTKRLWPKKFDVTKLQASKPVHIRPEISEEILETLFKYENN